MDSKLFDEFRAKLAHDREVMKGPEGKGGNVILGSETGPVGFALVEILFRIAQAQQKEIDELKRKLP
jgi:hypothetical protein